jgi:HPt (histidine-containing phosphotransfer) domain-containing protein
MSNLHLVTVVAKTDLFAVVTVRTADSGLVHAPGGCRKTEQGVRNQIVISLDKDGVLELLGGDQELLRDILGILLQELPRQLINLRQAITTGDTQAVEHLAHSIKGELGYLSLAEISHNACELEASGRNQDIARAASLFPALQAGISELLPLCAEWVEDWSHKAPL